MVGIEENLNLSLNIPVGKVLTGCCSLASWLKGPNAVYPVTVCQWIFNNIRDNVAPEWEQAAEQILVFPITSPVDDQTAPFPEYPAAPELVQVMRDTHWKEGNWTAHNLAKSQQLHNKHRILELPHDFW